MQASLPSVAAIHLSMTACISVRSVAWRLGRGSNTKIPADIYFFFFSLVILVEYHPYDSLYAGHVTRIVLTSLYLTFYYYRLVILLVVAISSYLISN